MNAAAEVRTGRAGEGSHFYTIDSDGHPAALYEVPRSKRGPTGETHRPATVADAKKLNSKGGCALGSFSAAWKTRSNRQLDQWRIVNAVLAALTSPLRLSYEAGELGEADFVEAILRDSEAEGRSAADEGTEIHTAIEQALLGYPYSPRWQRHVEATLAMLATLEPLGYWRAEVLFANRNLGYGGKVDALGRRWLVDFKTVKPWASKTPPVYDSWLPQLVAYRDGLMIHREVANLVISRGDDARVEVVKYDKEECAAACAEWDLTRRLYLHVSGLGPSLGLCEN